MINWALGIDIGGTNTKFALVDRKGQVKDAQSFRTQPQDSFETFRTRLKEHIDAYLVSHNIKESEVAIGVGAPNYSSVTELITSHNLGWGTFAIRRAFQDQFDCPVFMENDANVAAIGERLWGRGLGSDNFVVITVGTGIGSGVYSHGHLVVGHTGGGGEAGHLIVGDENKPCQCGGVDHFESYCSVMAIKEMAEQRFDKPLRYHDIADLFHDKDARIRQIYKEVAVYFARGLHQMIVCFSPSKIILAGGGMVVGQDYVDMIQTELDRIIFAPLKGTVQLEISDLSTSTGAVLGAAALVFEHRH